MLYSDGFESDIAQWPLDRPSPSPLRHDRLLAKFSNLNEETKRLVRECRWPVCVCARARMFVCV